MVKAAGCHPGDPSSIPGQTKPFFHSKISLFSSGGLLISQVAWLYTDRLRMDIGWSILGFQGGANYETISPNQSFINVANFESPKHLASYLVYLDNHPVSRKIYVSIYFHLYSKGLKFSGKVFRIFCLEENSFNYSKISHLCIVRNATSRPYRAKIILKSS